MQRLKNERERSSIIRSTQILQHSWFFGLGVLSWLGFSYLFLLFVKLSQSPSRSIYNFPWHADAPVWTFKICLAGAILIIFQKWAFGLLTEKSKSPLRDFLILIVLIPLDSLVVMAIFNFVWGVSYTGGEAAKDYDFVMSFLSGCITQTFVAMTCIGYFYLSLVNRTKEKLVQAQQARTAMELRTLQKNVEPHFLFNNLNVLSSLIESDPHKANLFLSRLAELYRYILQSQTLEMVSLRDELQFAESYVYLLRERFGAAYNFVWEAPKDKLDEQLIVPAALQSLIENAVKHNAGSNQKPLRITIKLNETGVTIENERREKTQTAATPQTGLQNLKMRYAFLTDEPIEIVSNERIFSVRLPLIQNK